MKMSQVANINQLNKVNQNVENNNEKPADDVETFLVNAEIPDHDDKSVKDVDPIQTLQNRLQIRDCELAECRKRILSLEQEVSEARTIKSQRQKDTNDVAALKMKSEETLKRAKSLIFDQTKVIKNQELQLEALNQQVDSLKDVIRITKDLLQIRNMEVKELEIKIKCLEDRMGAEKERQNLVHKKLEQMIRFNGDLKREYETQLCLFSALRERYNERELAKDVLTNEIIQVDNATIEEKPLQNDNDNCNNEGDCKDAN